MKTETGLLIWLTGSSGTGKTTIANKLKDALIRCNLPACVLDGDHVRLGLCSDLKYSPPDRQENVRRMGEVAKLFTEAGMICIVALISPYRRDRQQARSRFEPGQFIEVYVNAAVGVCEVRDPKGFYAKARARKIKEFTGISAPYEPPQNPEIELLTDQLSVAQSVDKILNYLKVSMPGPDCGLMLDHLPVESAGQYPACAASQKIESHGLRARRPLRTNT